MKLIFVPFLYKLLLSSAVIQCLLHNRTIFLLLKWINAKTYFSVQINARRDGASSLVREDRAACFPTQKRKSQRRSSHPPAKHAQPVSRRQT